MSDSMLNPIRRRIVSGLSLLILLMPSLTLASSVDDPMRPPQARQAQTPTPQPSWDLSSILISENRRLAVVNDEIVKVGERVGGARVEQIEADRVVLRRGEQRMVLTLRADLSISRRESN